MKSLVLAVLIAVTATTAGSAQSSDAAAPARAAATILPGTYDFQITFGGGVMEGTLEVTAVRGDSLTVVLKLGDHDSPVRLTQRRGNRMVLESPATGVQVRYDLEFRGETVTGPFTYDGNDGTVAGRRRAGR